MLLPCFSLQRNIKRNSLIIQICIKYTQTHFTFKIKFRFITHRKYLRHFQRNQTRHRLPIRKRNKCKKGIRYFSLLYCHIKYIYFYAKKKNCVTIKHMCVFRNFIVISLWLGNWSMNRNPRFKSHCIFNTPTAS